MAYSYFFHLALISFHKFINYTALARLKLKIIKPYNGDLYLGLNSYGVRQLNVDVHKTDSLK